MCVIMYMETLPSPVDVSKCVPPPGSWSAFLLPCLQKTQCSLPLHHHRLQSGHRSVNLGGRRGRRDWPLARAPTLTQTTPTILQYYKLCIPPRRCHLSVNQPSLIFLDLASKPVASLIPAQAWSACSFLSTAHTWDRTRERYTQLMNVYTPRSSVISTVLTRVCVSLHCSLLSVVWQSMVQLQNKN